MRATDTKLMDQGWMLEVNDPVPELISTSHPTVVPTPFGLPQGLNEFPVSWDVSIQAT